jgi:hypothetical protein
MKVPRGASVMQEFLHEFVIATLYLRATLGWSPGCRTFPPWCDQANFYASMTRRPGSCRVAKQKPETPLRLEIAPGIAAAHAGHTVIILEASNGSQVRVRDVATGAEQTVPVLELRGIAFGLTREEIQHRRARNGFEHGAENAWYVD